MTKIAEDIRRFLSGRRQFERRSVHMAAFRLSTGIDLSVALASSGQQRQRIVANLARLIERERLRGVRRHWSYDLNRHIALKQVLDELAGSLARQRSSKPTDNRPMKNGARRRRLQKNITP